MTERSKPEDWENIVETTFKIAETMIGRGKTYDLTIAKTLKIAGRYQDWLDTGRNEKRDLYDKVEELLNTWKDIQDDVSNLREKLIATLQKNQKVNSCQALITELLQERNIYETPRDGSLQQWDKSYIQSDNKTLKCISHAVSECCKELNFYVAPEVIQKTLTAIFQFQLCSEKNLLDAAADPKEFNRKIISFEMKDIKLYHQHDIDPQIEILIEEAKSSQYKFDEVYIYRANMGSNAPCYLVTYKAYDQQFVCYDTQYEVGPKIIRQPIKDINDAVFTLYKVKVINNLWTTLKEDTGDDWVFC